MEKKPDELTNDKNDNMLNFSQKLEMGKKDEKFFFSSQSSKVERPFMGHIDLCPPENYPFGKFDKKIKIKCLYRRQRSTLYKPYLI
jgi:hypothetical protein